MVALSSPTKLVNYLGHCSPFSTCALCSASPLGLHSPPVLTSKSCAFFQELLQAHSSEQPSLTCAILPCQRAVVPLDSKAHTLLGLNPPIL